MEIQLFQSEAVNPVLKIDPRTKLFLLLVMNIVMINGSTTGIASIYKPILACLPMLLLLTCKRNTTAISYAILFTLSWLVNGYLLPYINGLPAMILALLSSLFIRWFPCAMMGYYLLASTRVSEFVAAMEKMHISQKIIIPLSVMFRFFPTVSEESSAINSAMRMRNIKFGGRGGIMAILEYRLIPLMMSVVKIGDELSASALTRGLGSPEQRTSLCRIGFGVIDIVFLMVGVLALFIFFLL